MYTYKDDLDILKAAEKADTNKLTFNAITELDNKGLLGRYGEEGESGGIDLGITGASAGEYAKIKTVDADGVPTAWESGSGGGALVVEATLNEDTMTVTLNKTAGEIVAAFPLVFITYAIGSSVWCFRVNSYSDYDIETYRVDVGRNILVLIFEADTADDYPVAYIGE